MSYWQGMAANFAAAVLANPRGRFKIGGTTFEMDKKVASDKEVKKAGGFRGYLDGRTCWESVVYCLKAVSDQQFLRGTLSASVDEGVAKANLFPIAAAMTVRRPEDIPMDCVVGLFRAADPTDRNFGVLSHVMISIEAGGICAGSNNGCIDGNGLWSEVDLRTSLQWDPLGRANPRFVSIVDQKLLAAGKPISASPERVVKITRVSALLEDL